MKIDKISPKQGEVLSFIVEPEHMLICSGSVRSGKTLSVVIAFVIWAMEYFDKAIFAICGKTVSSAERNIIMPFQTIDNLPYSVDYRRSDRLMNVTCGKRSNLFYIFGGKDESSYALIQGITLSGVLLDEVALMPKSFVDQALARTLSVENAKIWFTCNPESPEHWFHTDYILGNQPGIKRLHFLMEDNPIMTPEKIKRAEQIFTGVFFQRYILGLWVRAEGVIFRQFADNPSNWLIDELTESEMRSLRFITFGVDYGENKSHTVFVATGFNRNASSIYALAERKLDSKGIDPVAIENAFVDFVRDIMRLYPGVRLTYAFCDHPETITNGINKRLQKERLPLVAVTARKEEINTRIYAQDKMLNLGIMKIHKRCPMLVHSLSNQVWDEKKTGDVRLDNNPDIADIADAWEYSWQPFIDEIGVR
jgi:PBSX family phage terminase large subunit